MKTSQQSELDNPFASGAVLLIDKPLGWTSFDVVRKLRNQVRTKKVGHAGTLDPLATGLLIVCTGKFTKKINEYMAQIKEYTGTIQLGASTPTYDLESEPVPTPGYTMGEEGIIRPDATLISMADVDADMNRFRGPIMQVPPIHSAIKINGKRVYELARKGKEVKLDPRPVTIEEFSCLQLEKGLIHFRVICTTGTYIRSLANDLGHAMGCGGYLTSLRRTRIGDFSVDDAMSMEAASVFITEQLERSVNP